MMSATNMRLHDRLSLALFDQSQTWGMAVSPDEIAEAVVGGMLRSAIDGGDPVSHVAFALNRVHFGRYGFRGPGYPSMVGDERSRIYP
jgi:hypothetical protein